VNRGLRSVLETQNFEVEIWVEYLDTRRRPGAENLAPERERLLRKYKGAALDLVISSDDDATALLAGPGSPMFGDTPVVFCGVSGTDLVSRLPRARFTGLIEVFQLDVLLNRMLELFPSTSRVVVVTDSAPSNAAHRQLLSELGERRNEIPFEYLDGTKLSFDEILARLRLVPQSGLVIASAFTHDRQGRYLTPFDSGKAIAEASAAPVVSQNTSELGQGFLVGNANRGFEHGKVTAQMALRVLKGEAPASIPIERNGSLRMRVDYAAMKKFGLSAAQLPAGSRIVNQPASWTGKFASNPPAVWGTLGFIILQSGIIAAFFVNKTSRRRAEGMRSEPRLPIGGGTGRLEGAGRGRLTR